MDNYADRLINAVEKKQNHTCMGLDPRLKQIPGFIKDNAIKKYGQTFEAVGAAIFEFNKTLIDACHDIIAIVKPQIAFYECHGQYGIRAFEATIRYAKDKGLIVVEDGKRNDIGSTAQAYADGHLGMVDFFETRSHNFDVDCITVSPYLGYDSIEPFLQVCKEHGKGIFVLVKTSNPSSKDLQDLKVGNMLIYEKMAKLVNEWGKGTEGNSGYSPIGAVVGATFPKEAETLRKLMPKSIFLVPGYGAQGGTAADVVPNYNADGYGAIVNSSRGLIFAYEADKYKHIGEDNFDQATRQACIDMQKEINAALKKADKCKW